jgi:diguanylate cyclase (GGDEF)-like protein
MSLKDSHKLKKKSLLFVDDDKSSLDFFKEMVEQIEEDFEILGCESGEEALALLEEKNIEVLVVDIVLPGISGLEVAENAKRLNPSVAVIVVTGYPTVDTAVRMLRTGVDDYISKPFDPIELEMSIRRGIEKTKLIHRFSSMDEFYSLLSNCWQMSQCDESYQIFPFADSFLKSEFGDSSRGFFQCEEGKCELVNDYPHKPFQADQFLVRRIASRAGSTVELIEEKNAKYLVMPLKNGLVWVGEVKDRLLPAWDKRVECLKEHMSSALSNIDKLKKAEYLAHVDDVTGLFNVRRLHKSLDAAIHDYHQNHEAFSVLFVDVDHFKKINDERGHLIGSRMLVEIGKELARHLREDDETFRYGGDEFVLVLSNTDEESATQIADRLRQRIAMKRFLAKENLNLRVTVSIGIATYPIHAHSKEDILEVADKAMYEVKKTSRNAIYVATSRAG